MRITNRRVAGQARHPIFQCPCGAKMDPQAAGKKYEVGGVLYCAADCSYYLATMPKK